MATRFRYSVLSLIECAACLAIGLGAVVCWRQLSSPHVSYASPVAGLVADLLLASVTVAFIVGRRFGDTRRKRVAVGILAFWAVLLTMGATLVVGLALHSFGELDRTVELRDLSYTQYCRHFDTGHFDPAGATRIDTYTHRYIDGYDCHMRIEIATAAYVALRERMIKNLEKPSYASYESADLGPVRLVGGDGTDAPSHWPAPDTAPPQWWQPSKANRTSARTCWELQTTSSGAVRSRGWYWLYDCDGKVLWIWEWNYQHCDLGWTTPKNKGVGVSPGASGLRPQAAGRELPSPPVGQAPP